MYQLIKKSFCITVISLLPLINSCSKSDHKPDPAPQPSDENNQDQKKDPPPTPENNQSEDLKLFPLDVGYTSANSHFAVKLDWQVGPRSGDESILVLTFAKGDHVKANTVTEVGFDAFMPGMGHGIPKKPITINQSTDNLHVYAVSGIYFGMGGAWDLTVTAKVNDNADAIKIPINF